MPATISHVKMVKILHYYFTGMSQPTIAQKYFINQSTVSRYVEKFKEEASAKGITVVAEEYQVMNEVSALRSLATDLYKSKTSAEEAKSGEYDPGFLVEIILGQLSGSTLDKLGCEYYGAEFVMLKRSQKLIQGSGLTGKIPLRCPDCGESLKTVVKTPLGSTLKKVIVTRKPTLEKPGIPSSEGSPPDHPETGKQA
jgi:predicted transcriptional regulator